MDMEKKPMGIVIGVGNQKGGVGKTTNTLHIAAALGEKGYRNLIIDLDPAAGATKHLGIPIQSFAGTLELLTTEETPQSLAIYEKMPKGVHLIPSYCGYQATQKPDSGGVRDCAYLCGHPNKFGG